MTDAAVVVAAGEGTRLGDRSGDVPKALVEVDGRTLLDLALTTILAVGRFDPVVVVHPPGLRDSFARIAGEDVRLVPGGARRSDSVRAGVAALDDRPDRVAIHDAARALVPPGVVARTLDEVAGDVIAAAPGLPVADTLKAVDDDGTVRRTVDRHGLWTAHTPQVVRGDVLAAVLAWAGDRHATDDLGLVEDAVHAGVVEGGIRLVPGDPRDLKITWPGDLVVAAMLVRGAGPDA